jgi:hypothetical protein
VADAHDWRAEASGRVFDLRTDLARPVSDASEALAEARAARAA